MLTWLGNTTWDLWLIVTSTLLLLQVFWMIWGHFLKKICTNLTNCILKFRVTQRNWWMNVNNDVLKLINKQVTWGWSSPPLCSLQQCSSDSFLQSHLRRWAKSPTFLLRPPHPSHHRSAHFYPQLSSIAMKQHSSVSLPSPLHLCPLV